MGYTYSPLPDWDSWVRLFKVDRNHATPSDSTIVWCRMHEFPISSMPKYKALSYEWGEPKAENSKEIYVDYTHLTVPKPLHAFLAQLSSSSDHKSEEYFFADAICLDQENDSEKTHQLQLMGRVFKQASRVHCWLGQPTNDLEKGLLELLALTGTLSRQEASSTLRRCMIHLVSEGSGVQIRGLLDSHIEDHLSYRISWIISLAGFLQKSYWSRMWMVQELILARCLTFQCGTYSFDGTQLDNWLPRRGHRGSINSVLDLFGAFEDTDDVPFSRAQPPWQDASRELTYGRLATLFEWRNNVKNPTLVQCIAEFGFSPCRFPRDRVYALLGLADGEPSWKKYPADVEKSPITIFFDTFVYCKDDAGSNLIRFARELWRMLALPPSAVSDGIGGRLPQSTIANIPEGADRNVSFSCELEREEMISRPSLLLHSPLLSFDVRPSRDLSGIGVAQLMNLSIASAARVTAVSLDAKTACRDDYILRIRGTSCGLVYDGRTRMLKGRYVVAPTPGDLNMACRLAACTYEWCSTEQRLPPLTRDITGSERAKVQVTSAAELLVFACHLQQEEIRKKVLPTGFAI